MRKRLIVVGLVLLAASVPGILNVVAKDHVSTAEGIWAWVSALAFVVSVPALVVLAALAARDFARRP